MLGYDAKQAFEKGVALFNTGKYSEAVPHFQKATELEPEYTQAYLYLGRSYLNLSKWIDAIPPLRTAYSLSPVETKKEVINILLDALIGGALAEFKKGNFSGSLNYLKEALDVDPGSLAAKNELPKTIIAYGGQLLSEGNAAEAISQFTEAVNLAPENLDGYLGLAKALLSNGNFFDAMKVVSDAMQIAPAESDRQLFKELLKK